MARSYGQLKKAYSIKGLEELGKKIIHSYIRSPLEYSQDNISQDYDITVDGIRKLMDFAIVHGAVSRKEAQLVMEKSKGNQQRKHPEAGGSSIRHHKQLMKERNVYIAYSFDKDKVKAIVQQAIRNPEREFESTILGYNLETKMTFYKTVERAIENMIISVDESREIIKLILKRYPTAKAREYWMDVFHQREANDILGQETSLEQALKWATLE